MKFTHIATGAVVDAVQAGPDNDLPDWLGAAIESGNASDHDDGTFTIPGAHANIGDWIVRAADGALGVVPADIFAATHQTVDAEPAASTWIGAVRQPRPWWRRLAIRTCRSLR